MAKYRLVNCEFLIASSFKVNVSNKGKLLYYQMLVSADDRGFVDTTKDIIEALTNNDKEFGEAITLELLENTYNSALNELIEKGFIYEFKDNHGNAIHLIRHWFFHNKLVKGLWTNYRNFLDEVYLDNNEYIIGKKPFKEDKIKQNKLKQIKLKQIKIIHNEEEQDGTELENDSDNSSLLNEFLVSKGVSSIKELTPEDLQEWYDLILKSEDNDEEEEL